MGEVTRSGARARRYQWVAGGWSALCFLVAAAELRADPDVEQTVGVFALTGTPDRDLEDVLVKRVAAAGYSVLTPARMGQEELAAIEVGVRCPERTVSCLGRVAAVAGIKTVLIGALDDGVPYQRLQLDLFDASAGRSRKSAAVMLTADPAERRLGVAAAVNAILLDKPLRGAVRLVEVPPGVLLLDGRAVAVEALSSLVPGPHRLVHKGEALAADFDVLAGLEREVVLTPLAPGDPEPPPSTAPYRRSEDGEEAGAATKGSWWLPGTLAAAAAGAAFALVPGLVIMAAGVLVAPYDDQRGEYSATDFNARRGLGRVIFTGGAGVAALGVAVAAGLGVGAVTTLPGEGE